MPRAARLPVDERRSRLLELGLELFSRRAYDDISTDDIATAAGVSKGLLYHYFAGKRGYYEATIAEVARRVSEAATLEAELPLLVAVPRALQRFVAFVSDNAVMYRAMLRGGVGADDQVQRIVEGVRQGVCRDVLARAGVAEPGPRLRSALYGWVGLAEATTLDWVSHERDQPARAIVAALVDAFMKLVDLPAPPRD